MPEMITREGEDVRDRGLEEALERPNAARVVPDERVGFPRSLGCAIDGIERTFATQRNMRIHGVAATLAAFASALLDLGRLEVLLVAGVAAAVLAAELVNTAIEAAVDLATIERHPLARTAKDAAAGAVLVLAALSAVVGAAIFGPKLVRMQLRPDGLEWAAGVAIVAVAFAIRVALLRRRRPAGAPGSVAVP